MTPEEINAKYISVPEIVADLREPGVTSTTVHNWLKYHRYMPAVEIVGRSVVERTEYEKFKAERPDREKVAEASDAKAA